MVTDCCRFLYTILWCCLQFFVFRFLFLDAHSPECVFLMIIFRRRRPCAVLISTTCIRRRDFIISSVVAAAVVRAYYELLSKTVCSCVSTSILRILCIYSYCWCYIIVVVSFIGMYCPLVSRGSVFLAKLHHPLDGVALLHS